MIQSVSQVVSCDSNCRSLVKKFEKSYEIIEEEKVKSAKKDRNVENDKEMKKCEEIEKSSEISERF